MCGRSSSSSSSYLAGYARSHAAMRLTLRVQRYMVVAHVRNARAVARVRIVHA